MKNKFDFTTIILVIVLIVLAVLAIMSFMGGNSTLNSLNGNSNNSNSIQFINSGFNPNTVNYNPQSPAVIQMQNNNSNII